MTEEQLKSGEVTKKLQGNRTDKCYWAQLLGEMPGLYCAVDKSKANNVYYDAAKKGWACEDFRLTDGTPLPIGLDFTAANVTYERKFNGTQNATLCLPYDLYAQGFKAYPSRAATKTKSISRKWTTSSRHTRRITSRLTVCHSSAAETSR